MKYLAVFMASAIGLIGQTSAQSCPTNGVYTCVNEGSSPDFQICNNNQWVVEPGPSGQICCMIGSVPKFFPGGCPGGTTQHSATTSANTPPPVTSTTKSPGSPTPTSGGGATHYGDLAKYHVYGSGELGACGFSVDDTAYMAVAVSQEYFTTANPNNDPICKTYLTIVGKDGKTIQAMIVDKKGIVAPDWSLDLNAVAYDALGGNHLSPGNIPLDHYTFNSFSALPSDVQKPSANSTSSHKKSGGKKKKHPKAHTKGRKANL